MIWPNLAVGLIDAGPNLIYIGVVALQWAGRLERTSFRIARQGLRVHECIDRGPVSRARIIMACEAYRPGSKALP